MPKIFRMDFSEIALSLGSHGSDREELKVPRPNSAQSSVVDTVESCHNHNERTNQSVTV